MRVLTSTLLAAQKRAGGTPYVKVEASNRIAGVVRLDWTRLYTGTEDDYYHGVTMPGDGSLIRVRLTPPVDGRKLYRQRVANPGPSSDFSSWTYTNQYGCVVVAAASLGAEASIFWINSSREIYHLKSTDYGASWGTPELIDYSATSDAAGLAAAYKPNGDLAIFFADQTTLYVKKRIGGNWQAEAVWDKATGDLSGVAVLYDADWDILVTGKDAPGNFKLWSLIYGDGGAVPSDTWSALKELAPAPSDGNYAYSGVFMDKSDVYRCFFIESFSGTEAYNRPFWSHSVLGATFNDNLWREPVPFNLSSQYGLALAHAGNYFWLSCPNGVWRAPLTAQTLDLTADVLTLRQETAKDRGRVAIELRNDNGGYTSLPALLAPGCELAVSPGYATASGKENSAGQTFCLESYEFTSTTGQASLLLLAEDGWSSIEIWQARHQFRWNKSSDETNVKNVLANILARVGLKLEAKSESAVISDFYPDFAISPGDGGRAVIQKLLSFVPDVLFIEGNTAYLVNPLASDTPAYGYGGEHSVLEGKYKRGNRRSSRVQVEGFDAGIGQPVIVDSFAWGEIDRLYDRLARDEDRNIGTVSGAVQRGEIRLRDAEIASASGHLIVPVNCGEQLFDVVDITDVRAGLTEEKWRVLGLTLLYYPRRGQYEQNLLLGAV